MPTERRRQRQQRVRHEAGDFLPSANEEKANETQNSCISLENKIEQNAIHKIETTKAEEPNRYVENKVEPSPVIIGNSFRRKDERRHNQKPKERQEVKRRPEPIPPQRRNEAVISKCNVAFEEQKEYEPVMIMESKIDKAKEEAVVVRSLPEPVKYKRSEVLSNWLRYEDLPPSDQPEEGEDYLMGEDFSQVLNFNVNKCSGGFLHLKGEVSWGNTEDFHLETHGLGALKVADLIASLGTIPFHEQLRIPEESLPVFTVQSMKASAEKNRQSYQPDQEYVTDIEINQKVLENLRLSEDEPLRLSVEEPKSPDRLNPYDATLKFSSAFKPEPTDVDLDSLGREGTPEYSPQERVTVSESSLSDFDKENGILNTDKIPTKEDKIPQDQTKLPQDQTKLPQDQTKLPQDQTKLPQDQTKLPEKSNKSPQHEPQKQISKPTTNSTSSTNTKFNFGLSKATSTNSTKTTAKPIDQVPSTAVKSEPAEVKIDLDKPVITRKEAPILVKDSEVENLEDWLDSVLDD